MEYKPYTYFLYCKPIKKAYYGVRYAKNCNPKDFFTKYYTSSKIIHVLLETFGKESFHYEIRKVFETADDAIKWEQKVLRRLKIQEKDFWLNRSLQGFQPNFYSKGQDPWNKGVPNTKMQGTKFYNNGEIQKMFVPRHRANAVGN